VSDDNRNLKPTRMLSLKQTLRDCPSPPRENRGGALSSTRSLRLWRGITLYLGLLAILAAVAPGVCAAQDTAAVIGAAALPRDLTLWGMYNDADPVVKAVLIGLVLASMATWTVWLTKTVEIWLEQRELAAGVDKIAGAHSLDDAVERLADANSEVGRLLEAAVREREASAGSRAIEGIKERIASRLERIEAASSRRIARGIGVLATIGATAPFVGLFGTVWGIMNSFIGISQARATNLAVVAPGIAEALLATALGLVAAIPAVVIYNVFARMIAGYRTRFGDATAEVLRLASRDLERAAASPKDLAAPPLSSVS
jgi:biopolymer transport protein ExbB